MAKIRLMRLDGTTVSRDELPVDPPRRIFANKPGTATVVVFERTAAIDDDGYTVYEELHEAFKGGTRGTAH